MRHVLFLLLIGGCCDLASAQPSIVTSSGGRSIVISGSSPEPVYVAPVESQPPVVRQSVVHLPEAVQQSPIYIVQFTKRGCQPCQTWASRELPVLRAAGIQVVPVDIDTDTKWGVDRAPAFWVVDFKTRRPLKKFKGYTAAVTLRQYESPPLPELPSSATDAPRYRIYDGVPGSSHQNRSSLINHILNDGVHAGKHTRRDLELLSDQQLDDLHTHDHRINGQVKHLSGPVTSQQQVRSRLPVVNTQWGRIDLETYNRNCNCPMCRGIRALQSQYRTLSLREDPRERSVSPAQEPTPDEVIEQMMDLLPLDSESLLADLGCGDGRILIAAVHRFGCNGIGIEIDPEKAQEARARVESEGLSHKIQIITGDALDFDPAEHGVTAVVTYLYPELLSKLSSKLKDIPVVASPFHEIPGLGMTRIGDVWIRRSSPEMN